MSTIKKLYDDDFNENINNSDKPVIVDFYSETCAPCKALMPTFEASSEAWADDISFFKVDASISSDVAIQEGIRSVPKIFIYHKGERTEVEDKTSKGIDLAITKVLADV